MRRESPRHEGGSRLGALRQLCAEAFLLRLQLCLRLSFDLFTEAIPLSSQLCKGLLLSRLSWGCCRRWRRRREFMGRGRRIACLLRGLRALRQLRTQPIAFGQKLCNALLTARRG